MPWRHIWGMEVYVQAFLPLALDADEWSASCPCHFNPRARIPSTQWIGGWAYQELKSGWSTHCLVSRTEKNFEKPLSWYQRTWSIFKLGTFQTQVGFIIAEIKLSSSSSLNFGVPWDKVAKIRCSLKLTIQNIHDPSIIPVFKITLQSVGIFYFQKPYILLNNKNTRKVMIGSCNLWFIIQSLIMLQSVHIGIMCYLIQVKCPIS